MDEWAFIGSEHFTVTAGAKKPNRPPTPCISAHEVRQLIAAGGCNQPTLVTEPCENRDMFYFAPNSPDGATGQCSATFDDLQQAHDAANNGSVFFFRPGNYSQPGGVLLTKPLKIFHQPTNGQSSAVITVP